MQPPTGKGHRIMSTRAVRYLRQQKIPFALVEYDHEEKGAAFAAQATGFPLEKTVKTLVVDLRNRQHVIALMPGHRELSLKLLAKAAGAKRAAMADAATAERLTGYLIGGISPFGTKHPLPAVMEQGLLSWDEVLINAGQRGAMLRMSPADIARVLACKVGPIARRD